ncbi:MAG: hypothetical protein L0Y44_16260 [Phycisphaerales bacterium]|nr:hypothetical protein [Phycisphaerales bacterium]
MTLFVSSAQIVGMLLFQCNRAVRFYNFSLVQADSAARFDLQIASCYFIASMSEILQIHTRDGEVGLSWEEAKEILHANIPYMNLIKTLRAFDFHRQPLFPIAPGMLVMQFPNMPDGFTHLGGGPKGTATLTIPGAKKTTTGSGKIVGERMIEQHANNAFFDFESQKAVPLQELLRQALSGGPSFDRRLRERLGVAQLEETAIKQGAGPQSPSPTPSPPE